VLQEFKLIREKYVLIVDDNLVGTREEHLEYCKSLFRAMIRADLGKKWVAQATINMADDEELLRLASGAGCIGVLIGFESVSVEGLREINKKFNSRGDRDFKTSIRRIQRHGILVAGSFIIGLDVHEPGIGRYIAENAYRYGLDVLDVTFLTPFPGTQLWDKMESENRIIANSFPEDWKYYTLTLPVARYRNLSWKDMLWEMETCYRTFYSYPRMTRRVLTNLWGMRKPFSTLGINLSCRRGALSFDRKIYRKLGLSHEEAGPNRNVMESEVRS